MVANNCARSGDCSHGEVAVLLGNGDGTFQSAVTYPAGGYSSYYGYIQVAVSDLNGDGKPDLVLGGQCGNIGDCSNGLVGILLGNGDGTFQQVQTSSSGGGFPLSIAVGDLNGDGKPDLVVTNECGNIGDCSNGLVGILLGNGDGTFQQVQTSSSGGYEPFSIAVGDVNGDGKPDLVVLNFSACSPNCHGSVVDVFLGNGDGTFQSPVTYNADPIGGLWVALSDLNGDGKLDVLVTDWGFSVLLGNGDGTFQPAQFQAGSAPLPAFAMADLNGDGKVDLIGAGGNGFSILIFIGNGDGTFQSPIAYPSGNYGPNAVAAADLNGDGRIDLVATNICADYANCGVSDGTVGVLLNSTMFVTTTRVTSAPNPSMYGQGVTFSATVASGGKGTPTGTVTFFDGVTNLGSSSLNNSGAATLSLSTLEAGTDSITASYNGDANFAASTSTTLSQTVNKAATVTAASSSPNPAVYGQPLTIAVTVAPQYGGTATGTVTFYDGTTVVGTAALSANVASVSGVILSAGSHTITASYGGDENVLGSNSSPLGQQVNQATTTTAVVSSPNPSLVNQNVTFTATMTSQYGGNVTGNVTFTVDSAPVAPVSVVNGQATYTTTFTAKATHQVAASYSGDANNAASTSSPLTQTVLSGPLAYVNPSSLNFGNQPVNTTSATKNIALSNNGDYQMTVSQFLITGDFQIQSNSCLKGVKPATHCNLLVTFTPTAAGARSGTLTLVDNATNNPQVVPLTGVGTAATTTTLTSSHNPSVYGQAVTLTALVIPTVGGGTPSGTVTFYNGTGGLGTGTLNQGVAALKTSALPAGGQSVTATYGGDPVYKTSTSSALIQTVRQASSTASLASSLNPSYVEQAVTFTATITGQYGGAATGTVAFKEGATTLATVPVSANKASYSTAFTKAGTFGITAVYSGDTNLKTSSKGISQVVKQYATTTSLTSAPNPSNFGRTLTLIASVVSTAPSGNTGTVTFKNGTAVLGTVALTGGKATLTTAKLPVGSDSLTAAYNGDTYNAKSISTAVIQTVKQAKVSMKLTSSPNPSVLGKAVKFTATLTSNGALPVGGTVTFASGGTTLGTAKVSAAGLAALSTTTLPHGSDVVKASYAGNADYSAASASVTQTVN